MSEFEEDNEEGLVEEVEELRKEVEVVKGQESEEEDDVEMVEE